MKAYHHFDEEQFDDVDVSVCFRMKLSEMRELRDALNKHKPGSYGPLDKLSDTLRWVLARYDEVRDGKWVSTNWGTERADGGAK